VTVAVDRSAAARRLCRRLADEIARIAPSGIGLCEPAWSSVAAASDDFLDLLYDWEQTGDEAVYPDLRCAYLDVVAAWQAAVARHEEGAHA
jgi:hypothetical protein